MKEDLFLNLIKAEIPESAQFIGDDTAYIPNKDLVMTQDTLIEDVHFRTRTISPYYLGRKAIAVNLSDIAAAGAIPEYVLISLSMPKSIDDKFIKEFYKGVSSICNEHGVLVVGGDLTAAEKITVSICAMGSGKGLTPANRRNARPYDVVILVGNCGSSAAGLYLLEEKPDMPQEIRTKFMEAHVNPEPKVKEGRRILELAGAPAMMDLSDGLADALFKVCDLSRVSMDIVFDEIPRDTDLNKVFPDETAIKNAVLFGGEDYSLLATIPENVYEQLKTELPVKKIGTVKKADTNCYAYVKFKDGVMRIDTETLDTGVFKHFE